MIEDLRKKRHREVLERQISKLERLKLNNTVKQHSSNSSKIGKSGHLNQVQVQISVQNKCWVINLAKTPLSDIQKSLFPHGPNFTVIPRIPLMKNS